MENFNVGTLLATCSCVFVISEKIAHWNRYSRYLPNGGFTIRYSYMCSKTYFVFLHVSTEIGLLNLCLSNGALNCK